MLGIGVAQALKRQLIAIVLAKHLKVRILMAVKVVMSKNAG